GHTFSGWSEVPQTMPAQDIVIEGYFIVDTGIDNAVEEQSEVIIYNINGERVLDTRKLERGIYIINGKKVFIK
ncbi:MAG: hypothetical protein Q4F44_02975, partial [Bacteroidales bacterium]|nr:hypothetical protein [Bacteroidales bacterium]